MTSPEICVRLSRVEEGDLLVRWLLQPETLQWFPMIDSREIEDAVKIWVSYIEKKATFTAEYQGVPAGMAILYIQPYERLRHQCLFAIIVDSEHRNRGVGTALIHHFEQVARNEFAIELLHLEVYEHNPALHLYKRMGFEEYGRHPRFIKEGDHYATKVLMQKRLI